MLTSLASSIALSVLKTGIASGNGMKKNSTNGLIKSILILMLKFKILNSRSKVNCVSEERKVTTLIQ